MKTFPIIILNDARPANSANGLRCLIRNREDSAKPVEVLIYDTIGKDWDGTGFDAKDFVKNLEGLDENRELTVRVNSRGGGVDEGIAIYNRLLEWKGKTVAIVDGAAASIASVLIMGADEVHMPESAEILIHEAHAFLIEQVNSDDLDKLYDQLKPRLESASDRIAGIYAKKSGRSREEMRNYMRKTSIFNGRQAKELGLADVVTDDIPLYNFTPGEISRFRAEADRKPTKKTAADDSGKAASPMKKKLLALLNKHGIKASDNKALDTLSVEELFALSGESIIGGVLPQEEYDTLVNEFFPARNKSSAEPKKNGTELGLTAEDVRRLEAKLDASEKRADAEKKNRISAEIDRLIGNSQLPGAGREKYIARAMADETILDEYRANPSNPPGVEPLANLEVTGEDPKDIAKGVEKLRAPIEHGLRNNAFDSAAISRNSIATHRLLAKHEAKLVPLFNTNTISSDLKRVIILNSILRALKRRMINLNVFATVFNNVALEGTDEIAVPYYPLHTTASNNFGSGPYTFNHNKTISSKKVTINKRKYQPLNFSSSELARQPYLDVMRLAMVAAEQLGVDVFNDVLSAVTLATYGAAVKNEAYDAFDIDDVIDIGVACDQADWPDSGRSLLIDSAYKGNLNKSLVTNLNAGDQPLRNGAIGRLEGFDVFSSPRIPDNAENLKGMAVYQSGLLVATSPITPAPGVRRQLVSYDQVTDPDTGVTFEYRYWGDADADEDREVIESNYGYIAGEPAAIKRVTTP